MRHALVVLALFGVACEERRKPIKLSGDLGPSVVVLDPVKRPIGAPPPVPMVDETEPDDDLGHAQPLPAGQGVKGTIGPPKTVKTKKLSDDDYYSFTAAGAAPDGGFLVARIDLMGIPGTDLVLEALDGDGKRLWLANEGGVGEGEVIGNLGVSPANTYYLRVRAIEPAEGQKPYELVVRLGAPSPGEEREPNDDTTRAMVMPVVSDGSGFFGRRRDEDWIKLAAPATPSTLRIELSPIDGVSSQVRVLVGNPPQLSVLADSRSGRGEELRLRNVGVPYAAGDTGPRGAAGVPAGDLPVWLQLKALEGRNPDVRWLLRLQWEAPLEGAEREPNDTVAQAMALSLAGQAQVSGFLWAGDSDVYKVTGVEDALVGAELDGLDRVDLRLERLAADGRVVAKANEGGAGKPERMPPFPIAKGEEVFLKVTGRARDVAFDAPYRLTLTPGPK